MKYKLTPDKETLETNIIERTIGRAVSVEPATEPFGPATRDLLGDIFHALYNAEMTPKEAKYVPTDRTINHALMNWMSNDEAFMQARNKTRGKLLNSLVSTKFLYEYLITDEAIRKALEVQEPPEPPPGMPSAGGNGDQNDQNQQGGQGQMSMPNMGDSGSSGKPNQPQSPKSKQEQDAALQAALDKINRLQKNPIGSQIMTLGAQKAEEQSDKADSAMRSWGVEPGDITVNNIDDIMNLVDQNSEKITQISDLAGRFESIVVSALTKARESYVGQVVDVKRTKDFSLIYPTELCYLMSPDVPKSLHNRYVTDYIEAGLLGAEVRSEGKEFGSLYMAVDGSGSMDGQNEIYAKSIAIGLARALNRDVLNNRVYKLMTFGAGGDPFFKVSSNEAWDAHFKWAGLQQSGGTSFDHAFNEAMRDIAEMPEGTDLAFITDGQCELNDYMMEKWKEFKEKTGTRLLYVDISGRENQHLREICDLYLRVDFDKDGNMSVVADDIASKLAENMETARLSKIHVESDT